MYVETQPCLTLLYIMTELCMRKVALLRRRLVNISVVLPCLGNSYQLAEYCLSLRLLRHQSVSAPSS